MKDLQKLQNLVFQNLNLYWHMPLLKYAPKRKGLGANFKVLTVPVNFKIQGQVLANILQDSSEVQFSPKLYLQQRRILNFL